MMVYDAVPGDMKCTLRAPQKVPVFQLYEKVKSAGTDLALKRWTVVSVTVLVCCCVNYDSPMNFGTKNDFLNGLFDSFTRPGNQNSTVKTPKSACHQEFLCGLYPFFTT